MTGTPSPDAAPTPTGHSTPPSPRVTPGLVAVVVVVVVAFAGGGIYLLTNDDGEDDQGSATTTTSGNGTQPTTTAQTDDPPATNADSPEDVVDAYLAAADDGDCRTMVDLTGGTVIVGASREDRIENCEELRDLDVLSRIEDVERSGRAEVDGDTAVVAVDDPRRDGPIVEGPVPLEAFELAREDGAWKIHDIVYVERVADSGS